MTQFVIYGQMDESKNLLFDAPAQCSQGENGTVNLSVSVPNGMAQGVDFYFEFLCPHNLWVSPRVEVVAGENYTQLTYPLPACVLQEEGLVMVQLCARNTTDQTVVFKSFLSTESSFAVTQSVNATIPTPKVVDFFGEAVNGIKKMQDKLDTLSDVAYSGEYDHLRNAPQKLSQFQNDVGYVTTTQVQQSLPTNVSELNNDSGFVTMTDVYNATPTEVSQLNNDSGYVNMTQVQNALPTKVSQLANDTSYATISQVQGMLPVDVSELNNDEGYLTSTTVQDYLPTKLSQLENDIGLGSGGGSTATLPFYNETGTLMAGNHTEEGDVLEVSFTEGQHIDLFLRDLECNNGYGTPENAMFIDQVTVGSKVNTFTFETTDFSGGGGVVWLRLIHFTDDYINSISTKGAFAYMLNGKFVGYVRDFEYSGTGGVLSISCRKNADQSHDTQYDLSVR